MSTLLLSLLPLSCIVASERDLVNILFPFTINPTNSLQDHSAITPMYIKINTSRGWSSGHNFNSSRKLLVLSNTSSVTYVDHIQVIVNCQDRWQRTSFFIFSFHFILFFFVFFLFFSIFRTTRVRVYQSWCHISHKLIA